jgi:Recombinase
MRTSAPASPPRCLWCRIAASESSGELPSGVVRRASAGGPSRPSGRPAALPPQLVEHIGAEHACGKSLAQIARDLNASGTPTAHGGRQWWPSTVRAVLRRS